MGAAWEQPVAKESLSRSIQVTREELRLEASRQRKEHWKRWAPYLSERAWGTVREDYSEYGTAWEFLPHDHARSHTYRWNEDGIAGICDRHQKICFAVALWNGKDPILKERLFGLTGNEGNHGEDVKECYYYLDSTSRHSYMRYLYKYPQAIFPYQSLVEENRRRGRGQPEFELLDTGLFKDGRYFDVFVEYAKADVEDILVRVTVHNRGPEPASLHLLPTVWFRNTWSWGCGNPGPSLKLCEKNGAVIELSERDYGKRWMTFEGHPNLLFTENETNTRRLYHYDNGARYAKDAINDFVVNGKADAVNPAQTGTKASAHYELNLVAGGSASVKIRLTNTASGPGVTGSEFDKAFTERRREADEFYSTLIPSHLSQDTQNVMRQSFAGLLWSKQYYHYVVSEWLEGDPAGPPPPEGHKHGRNRDWLHLYNADVISMPDKWEYPWYASWDLAFQCVALALVDPDFAKEQLMLMVREWYMHPNGQIPAYEWALDDVNPPVHAWAAWRVYKIEKKRRGVGDRTFLERIFHKLLLNFTWWVNRKDTEGRNVFQGGFLGLDNIGVFDRGAPLPTGGFIEQADGTGWMGMYCLNLLAIAMELAREDPAYEDVASKFWEHFIYIADAINNLGHQRNCMWNEEDGFFYDALHTPQGQVPMRLRSMVGLVPLFAVEILEPWIVKRLPGFERRLEWFIRYRPELTKNVACMTTRGAGERRLLSIVNAKQLRRVLGYMLDESEFLSPYGIRAMSRRYKDTPFVLPLNGSEYQVRYEPGESSTGVFGGNSNWRGPIWFPVNFLLIESLQKLHHYYGPEFKVECPTGSGVYRTLWEVAAELSQRLVHIFLKTPEGKRPANGANSVYAEDPYWRDLIMFHEYFHGDDGSGLGSNHQTGWTGLVAKLLQQNGE